MQLGFQSGPKPENGPNIGPTAHTRLYFHQNLFLRQSLYHLRGQQSTVQITSYWPHIQNPCCKPTRILSCKLSLFFFSLRSFGLSAFSSIDMEVALSSRFSIDMPVLSSSSSRLRVRNLKKAQNPSGVSVCSSLTTNFVAPFVGGSVTGDFCGQKIRPRSLNPSLTGSRGKRGVVTMVFIWTFLLPPLSPFEFKSNLFWWVGTGIVWVCELSTVMGGSGGFGWWGFF